MEEPAQDDFFGYAYIEVGTLPEETVMAGIFFEEEVVGAAEEDPSENTSE